MGDINNVSLTGRLGQNFELRHTPQGTAVTENNLAVQDGFGDKEKTYWVGITIWGKSAEAAAKYLEKGRKIAISGRLTQDSWEDKDTGKPRTKTRVTVENWTFADSKGSESKAPQQSTEPVTTRNVHPDQNSGDDIPF